MVYTAKLEQERTEEARSNPFTKPILSANSQIQYVWSCAWRSRKWEIVDVCVVIEDGEGEKHAADVYLLQRRQVEAVHHSCFETLRKVSLPRESRAPGWKHEGLQHWEHGQKRGDFFQIG